ncbi:MAG: cytochrome c oxidase subunit II, partial [Desulfuromusa sp.]|nr:cytochrome c oxidase subunit II [Desulfuromusa sp.]
MNQLNNPTAQAVDNVLIYIFGFSLILLLGITVVTIYFVVKYRRSKYPEPTSQVEGSWLLEITWTVLPIIIVMTMFWYGWTNYVGLREVPEGALEVSATARMWSWQFEYPDGRKESKLYVPVNTPIKVQLHSVDVIHSFFVPAFRIKRDTVPKIDSYVW